MLGRALSMLLLTAATPPAHAAAPIPRPLADETEADRTASDARARKTVKAR